MAKSYRPIGNLNNNFQRVFYSDTIENKIVFDFGIRFVFRIIYTNVISSYFHNKLGQSENNNIEFKSNELISRNYEIYIHKTKKVKLLS